MGPSWAPAPPPLNRLSCGSQGGGGGRVDNAWVQRAPECTWSNIPAWRFRSIGKLQIPKPMKIWKKRSTVSFSCRKNYSFPCVTHMGPSQTLAGGPVEWIGTRALIEHGCSPGPLERVKLQTLADPKRLDGGWRYFCTMVASWFVSSCITVIAQRIHFT